MKKGIFITLEGPDGSGKSTQVGNIKKYFEKRGIKTLISREPGGTSIGEKLREILLNKSNSEMNCMTEMLIYAAARAQHVNEKIRPALERGEVVVCDRFVDSSIAYQGYGRGLAEKVMEINKYAVEGTMPDITFFLDIDPAEGKKRISGGELDRLEQEALEFHNSVYKGYIKIAENEPERVIRIDASRSADEVKESIFEYLDKFIKEWEK